MLERIELEVMLMGEVFNTICQIMFSESMITVQEQTLFSRARAIPLYIP